MIGQQFLLKDGSSVVEDALLTVKRGKIRQG
jgi:hypothetical protein